MTKRVGAFVISMIVSTTSGLVGARAEAQETPASFGERGQLVLSAERLFGFIRADTTTSAGGTDLTTHINALSLLGNAAGLFTLYAQPRVAVDFLPAEHFSVGASVTYFRISESATSSSSNPVVSGYALAPRLGYALALARIVSVWPRLGFTFAHLGTESTNPGIGGGTSTNGTSVYAVTIDVPFVFTVTPHFYLSVAPTADIGLGGSTSSSGGGINSPSTDSKETDYGVLCGLGGFL